METMSFPHGFYDNKKTIPEAPARLDTVLPADYHPVFRDKSARETVKKRIGELEQAIEKHHPAVLVFLDRGARPTYEMLRAARQAHARRLDSAPLPPLPAVRFLNLGREKKALFGVETPDGNLEEQQSFWDNQKLDSSKWAGVDTSYQTTGNTSAAKHDLIDALKKTLRDVPGPIMVVDDYSHTGSTTAITRSFFKNFFPDRQIINHQAFHLDDQRALSENPHDITFRWTADKRFTGVRESQPGSLLADSIPKDQKTRPDHGPDASTDRKIAQLFRKEIDLLFSLDDQEFQKHVINLRGKEEEKDDIAAKEMLAGLMGSLRKEMAGVRFNIITDHSFELPEGISVRCTKSAWAIEFAVIIPPGHAFAQRLHRPANETYGQDFKLEGFKLELPRPEQRRPATLSIDYQVDGYPNHYPIEFRRDLERQDKLIPTDTIDLFSGKQVSCINDILLKIGLQ